MYKPSRSPNPNLYSEEDTKTKLITPAIRQAGWHDDFFCMEYTFTEGRVLYDGEKHQRGSRKRADYLLLARANYPIAVIEAKAYSRPLGEGMQQAIEYAKMLDVPFAYSTNGKDFLEHDLITGKEQKIPMDAFPSPQALNERWMAEKQQSPEVQEIIDAAPYYTSSNENFHEPRYYQRIAINRTIEAIAKGQKRILLVMATGTGKTYTAFQIIYRLRKSGILKKRGGTGRILYLADRNILIDQTMAQDFKPFDKSMVKVQQSKIDTSHEIFLALYHQLVGREGEPKPFEQVDPSFFDLVIVDECHRGSAKDDSNWRAVLDYFQSAVQIGMTATPKVDAGANNVDYFGEPLYTYSLAQGIRDGFLAPYRVTNCTIDSDVKGYTPKPGEVDLYGTPIEQKLYTQGDYGTVLHLINRRICVAKRITQMLRQIGRMTKTIVFLPTVEEAQAMRSVLANLNRDKCQEDHRYVMSITGEDLVGKQQLDNFISVKSCYPTVVTTSELLATGVDCKTCGLIVIDKEINSMTEFKQIIGRGTRLRTDYGKWHLEILDFRNATDHFYDPAFDPDPDEWIVKPEPKPTTSPNKPKPRTPSNISEPRAKYTVQGEDYTVIAEWTTDLGSDGKTMNTSSIKECIQGRYKTLDDFINNWSASQRKQAILKELWGDDKLLEEARKQNPALAEADDFDIICHIAYGQRIVTRKERAQNVRKSNYLAQYQGEAREVLEALLDKFAENGIQDIEDANVWDHDPFNQYGKPQRIAKLFGDEDGLQQALTELKNELYKSVA